MSDSVDLVQLRLMCPSPPPTTISVGGAGGVMSYVVSFQTATALFATVRVPSTNMK
jgi:hypothetical protein